jgi:RNA polymerase sigma factor (sigma-70 family)
MSSFNAPIEERGVESYLQEARAMIGRFGSSWMIKDQDVVGNVASAIAKAEHDYDPSRGNKRVTVRITYGRYQIIKELRNIKRWQNRPTHFSMDAPIYGGFDGYNDDPSGSCRNNDVEDYREPSYIERVREENIEYNKAKVKRIIKENKTMTKKQKKYIVLRYVKGMEQKHIAKKLGCSKQAVNQVLLAGVAKLKKDLL